MTTTEKKPELAMIPGKGFEIRTLEAAYRFAQGVVKSGLAPKGDTAEAVVVKLQAGSELGFPPMQSLAVLTVVNGRLGVMGVGAVALILRHPDCQQFVTGNDGEGEDRCGYVVTQRKGQPAFRIEFSARDAKRAGLLGKAGPWKDYPDDMLIWRAVSRAARRYWPDALLGIPLAEEIQDYPQSRGEAVVIRPTPVDAAPDPLLLEDVATAEAEMEAEADELFAPAETTRCPACGFPYADPDQERCGNCGENR